jgi:hypothetical protein
MFREGALVNVKGTYADMTITLSKIDNTVGVPMLAMVNGSFEPIPAAAATIPVAQAKLFFTDPIYLHWVVWKVTDDRVKTTVCKV